MLLQAGPLGLSNRLPKNNFSSRYLMNPSRRFYDPATGEMCFGVALESLRNGKRVRRKSWESGWFISYVMLEIAPMTNLTSKDIIAKDWVEIYDDTTTGEALP